MPDHLTPEQRSRAMRSVKLKGGSIEKIVRTELRLRRFHFEENVKSLPGSPDIVFWREKVAVFVEGDFWHGWRLPQWERKLTPFWRKKLRANRVRDTRNIRKLRSKGWSVLRLWEHQLAKDKDGCIKRILRALT